MKCIVLAAGKDKNSIDKTPKFLQMINNKTVLDYFVDTLDVETLKIDKTDGNINELGKKLNSYEDIERQYIGLIKIRKDVVKQIKHYYENLDQTAAYDGKNYDNMYMTSFLQMIAHNIMPLSPVYIKGGWNEIDEPSDLNFGDFLQA